MSIDIDARSKKRAFTVFIGCCLMQMVGLGTVLNSSSAFFAIVPGSVGLGMGEFALWLSAYSIAAFVATAIAGNLYTKFGAKKVISIAVIVSALATYCFSLATQTWHFVAIGVVLGLSGGMYFLYACPVLMNAWFVKRRGTYLSVANIFSGIGGAIWPLLFTSLFGSIGYQNVYLLNAILILVCILPFALTVFSLKPEDSGLHAYGVNESDREEDTADKSSRAGVPVGKAIASAAFVFGIVGCALCAFPGSFNSYMQAFTVSVLGPDFLVWSATMMIALQLGYIVATPIAGICADKFGIKPVTIILIVLLVLCYLAFTIVQTQIMLLLVAFLFGMNNTLVTVSVPMMVRDWFGGRDYEKILGYMMAVVGLLGGNAAPVIGACIDATGGYTLAFYVAAGVAIVSLICILVAYPASKKLQMTHRVEA